MGTEVIILGADGGLGHELVLALANEGGVSNIIAINGPNHGEQFPKKNEFDFLRASEVRRAAIWASGKADHNSDYRVVVNCIGVNYIEWFASLDFAGYQEVMDLNVRSWLVFLQELLAIEGFLCRGSSQKLTQGTFLNVISNASHMPMTNSVAYNASKGAQHIATLSLARELFKTHGLRVFGISPNKLSGTGMSSYIEGRVPALRGWTKEQAEAYQKAALPTGEETDPKVLAEFMAFLIAEPHRHKYLHGNILPYGA